MVAGGKGQLVCAGLLLRHGDTGHQVQKKIKEKPRIPLGAASSCGPSLGTGAPVHAKALSDVVDALPSLISGRKNG